MGVNEVYNATGYHKYNKRDWTVTEGLPPAGPVTFVEAMGRSTNDYFWEIALGLRPTGSRECRWSRKLGLGQPTGIPLAENAEMRGLSHALMEACRSTGSLGTSRRRWTW